MVGGADGLFSITPTIAYKNLIKDEEGEIPVVTNSIFNQGITAYSKQPATEENVLTFSDTVSGSAISYFYHDYPFIGFSHVQKMLPNSFELNKYTAKYFIGCLKKASLDQYDYHAKMNRDEVSSLFIELPVTNNKINFDYMEAIIKECEKDCVRQQQYDLENEIKTYLSVIDQDDYELNEKEKFSITKSVDLKSFRLGNIFEIHPTKSYGLKNNNLFKTKGDVPVVVNSSLNNGIGGRVNLAPTENANTITFSDTTSADSIFVQDENFIGYSHVQGLYPLNGETFNTLELLYIATLMRKIAIQKGFDYGYKFNRAIAIDFKLPLPILEDGALDKKFMNIFIKAVEKLVIKDVVDRKNKEIEATKKIVNN